MGASNKLAECVIPNRVEINGLHRGILCALQIGDYPYFTSTMNANIYQVLHVVGILMLFLGYGALLARSMAAPDNAPVRKLGSITSGIGLLLILIAGFAMISKLGHSFAAPWLIAKMVIWLILGGLIVLINRKPQLAVTLWWLLIVLGAIAASLVYIIRF